MPTKSTVATLALALAACAAPQAAPQIEPASAAPCAGASRQFDFWLGEWEIAPRATGQRNGRSSITRAQDGCVLVERYRAEIGGNSAMSFSAFDERRGIWRHTWASASLISRAFAAPTGRSS